MCVPRCGREWTISGPESDDEPFTLTSFPWMKHTRNDFGEPFNVREPKGPFLDFVTEQIISISKSYGLIMNSFHELEGKFIDYWNRECEPKAWSIGPLCLAESQRNELQPNQKPTWMQWLDQKLAQGSSVLYIAFGESELADKFEERVKEKGIVVREWVDQRAILGHESIQGFLSHCGWNSVLESICARVPILAWPMMVEQHLNASMVVEEIKVGLRVETTNGPVRGFVKWQGLGKMVRELMEGEMGKEVRNNVGEFGEAAKKAMKEGGSSWHTLNQLIDELQALRGDSLKLCC
ncbi:hypothetical protein TEA_009988 [Camellia sinensis var. sinensis]|uniref:Uncharacterized protein n=1 Tax=Camellia sinensis var. sinensis TaxID=542762 RepID=A0A4S4E2B9_CAMSN|nr:hypothetical protein TEA_009988 [Camellia sinensis var. sinensis]